MQTLVNEKLTELKNSVWVNIYFISLFILAVSSPLAWGFIYSLNFWHDIEAIEHVWKNPTNSAFLLSKFTLVTVSCVPKTK